MKRYISYILLLLSVQIYAQQGTRPFGKKPIPNLENFQKQWFHFGYYLGLNYYTYKIEYKQWQEPEIQIVSNSGFNLGMVCNLRLSDNFDLRFEPGLYYGTKSIYFPTSTTKNDSLREVVSANIHLPMLIKYSAVRTGNIRPYLLSGFSVSRNLSSNYNAKDDNSAQKFRVAKWTLNYEVGTGIDIFFQYFIFSPSIKGVFGLQNELIPDADPNSPWTGNIESMKTRAFIVNFTFH